MQDSLHTLFGWFWVSFEPIDPITKPNEYSVINFHPDHEATMDFPANGIVKFRNYKGQHELPIPALLATHAVVTIHFFAYSLSMLDDEPIGKSFEEKENPSWLYKSIKGDQKKKKMVGST